jgi:hypothetical protein
MDKSIANYLIPIEKWEKAHIWSKLQCML